MSKRIVPVVGASTEARSCSLIYVIGVPLLVTCFTMGARASALDGPENITPQPGMIEPHYEVGARYWWSEGKTKSSIDSSKIDPSLGNPTSTLTYDNVQGNAAEFVFRARTESNYFAKGFVGGGFLNSGTLDDSDFFAGQVKFSNTESRLNGDNLIYGTLDVGRRFMLSDGATNVTVGPFIGFNLQQEDDETYGIRCKADDVGGAFCGPAGSIAVPFSTKVIGNEADWAALRLGGEMQVKLYDRFTFIGDAAILPIDYLVDNDSHYLRADLGPVPNIQDSGRGWGYQLEGVLRMGLSPNWSLGSGVRYWFAEVSDGSSKYVHINTAVELSDFTSQRFGVFSDLSYRF
jgi:hypothetical protein